MQLTTIMVIVVTGTDQMWLPSPRMRRMENGLFFSILLNHVFTTTTLIVVKWNTILSPFFHRWMLLRHHGLLHREKILEMVSHQKCASEYLDFSSSRMNGKSLSLWPVSLDTVNSQLTSTHTPPPTCLESHRYTLGTWAPVSSTCVGLLPFWTVPLIWCRPLKDANARRWWRWWWGCTIITPLSGAAGVKAHRSPEGARMNVYNFAPLSNPSE